MGREHLRCDVVFHPAPARLAAAFALLASFVGLPVEVRAEEPAATEATTLVYVRSSEPWAEVWVTDALFPGASEDDWVYPAVSPCMTPCLLRLPDGRYDLSVGRVDFATRASGGLQVWDVEPTLSWLRGLAIGMDVVGGLLLGSLLVNAFVVLLSALAMDSTGGMSRDTMIGVGATGGVLVLGSIPAWAIYAASGSSTLTLEDPGFDLGGRVVVTPGAVVLPWPADTPAFALGLRGTWGGFRAPHERRRSETAEEP